MIDRGVNIKRLRREIRKKRFAPFIPIALLISKYTAILALTTIVADGVAQGVATKIADELSPPKKNE